MKRLFFSLILAVSFLVVESTTFSDPVVEELRILQSDDDSGSTSSPPSAAPSAQKISSDANSTTIAPTVENDNANDKNGRKNSKADNTPPGASLSAPPSVSPSAFSSASPSAYRSTSPSTSPSLSPVATVDPCQDKIACDECKAVETGVDEEFCLWKDGKCQKVSTADHSPEDNVCETPDPCPNAETCEKCDEQTLDENDQACIWKENKCIKGPASEKETDMCAPPPVDDPCATPDTCEKCQAASSKLTADDDDDKICVWNGEGCAKETKADHPEAASSSMCLCFDAATCQDCKTAASDASLDSTTTTCAWTDDACSVTKREGSTEITCPGDAAPPAPVPSAAPSTAPTAAEIPTVPETPTADATPTADGTPTASETPTADVPTAEEDKGDGNSEESSSKAIWFVGLVFFSACCWLYRKRSMGGVVPHIGEIGGGKRYHKTGVYEHISTTEAETLHRRDSDEWGWDEEEGDVELAGAGSFGSASYQDQPEKKTPPSQKKRLVRRTASKDKEELPMVPSVQKPAPKGLSLHARKASGSPIPPAKHSQAISSLGAKPSVPAVPQKKAPAPPPVPKEDDFFAEMGFSAQPTFTAAKAKPATRLAPAPAPAAKASSLYAISGDDDLGGDGDDDWGDDADLDDLLND